MTKKDYIVFANAFKDALGKECFDRHPKAHVDIETVDNLVLTCARIFKSDNPAFRPVQFFTACGYSTVQAGYMAAKL
jgi:hypothetical protein